MAQRSPACLSEGGGWASGEGEEQREEFFSGPGSGPLFGLVSPVVFWSVAAVSVRQERLTGTGAA